MTRLLLTQPHATPDLVSRSYDRIAAGYDDAWTAHMRDLSLAMLGHLRIGPGASCIDLTCGTGFLTAELARRSHSSEPAPAPGRAVGVDASAGMLSVAHQHHGGKCRFTHADALSFLRCQPAASADIITCGWGLGYTRPLAVVRQIARVLRPGGQVGIIDNSLFSLAGVLWASVLAFAECPGALDHVMHVRFLPGSWALASLMRACGLRVRHQMDGARTYRVGDGQAAIARLTSTGAAAGFEFAASAEHRQAAFDRFARVLHECFGGPDGIGITHRYLCVIGSKPT